MSSIKMLALDPAMANLGSAWLRIDTDTLAIEVEKISLIHTEGEVTKMTRRNSDDLRRAGLLLSAIREGEQWADLVAAEVPVGTQSARGAMSNGICVGLLAAIQKPLIQVQPSETKMASVGRKTASKDEIIAWANALYPNAAWAKRKLKGQIVLTDKNEHMADAIAIGYAAIKTAEFRAALAMLKFLQAGLPSSVGAANK